MTIPDMTALDDADLAAAIAAGVAEQDRRRIIAAARQVTASLAEQYSAAVAGEAPLDWATVPDAIGPGQAVTWTDGHRWRNTSGTWLPKTATPAAYPLGWRQETGLPAQVPAWSATGTYKPGDLVTYQGQTWRCLQAHAANSTWTPPAAVSLWTLA